MKNAISFGALITGTEMQNGPLVGSCRLKVSWRA